MKKRTILLCILTALFLGAALATSAGAPIQPSPLSIVVPATVEWTFSGFKVQAGQTVQVNAVGYACTSIEYGLDSTSDPGGQVEGLGCGQYEDAPWPCALDDAPYGMLVAKVVGPKGVVVFPIGNASVFKAPAAGYVYLSVNDNLGYYTDNQGHYLVTFR